MKLAVVAAAVWALAVVVSAQPASSLARRNSESPAHTGSASDAVAFPVDQLRAQLASYIAEAKARGSAGATLEDFGRYKLEALVLGRSSGAEVLAHWSEVTVMEQGSAMLITGGQIVDARRSADGDRYGLRVERGRQQVVAAGDVVTVRAGTPQQWLLSPGTVCSMFVIQIREP